MLNRSGIDKQTATAPTQILANVEMQMSVGCNLAETTLFDDIVPAGTPLTVDFSNLQKAATVGGGEASPSSATLSVTGPDASYIDVDAVTVNLAVFEHHYEVEALGLTDGVFVVTHSYNETTETLDWYIGKQGSSQGPLYFDISDGVFTFSGYDPVEDFKDKDFTLEIHYVAAKEAVTPNAVLLHDVEVSDKMNGTALYFGTVNYNRLSTVVQTLYASLGIDCGVNAIGSVSIIKA